MNRMNRKLNKFLRTMARVRRIESDDVLARLGLMRRRSVLDRILSTIGILSAGIVVGAGVGLLVSPIAPADARKKLGEGMRTVKNEVRDLVSHERGGGRTASRIGSDIRDIKNGAVSP